MKNLFITLITFITVITFISPSVSADSGQYGQYGQYGSPAPAQTILIDKMVGKVTGTTKGGVVNVTYVDNLTPADPRFTPGAQVMFSIKVKNTSTVTISNITVNDYVPSYVEPMEGPGTYNSSTRVVSWNIASLAPDQEMVFYLKMQLFGQAQLPADKGLFCLTNKATAGNGSASDQDSSQFCVEKEVIGVKKAPAAGPEAGALILGANAILAGVGFSLKRLTSKK